MFKTLMAQDIAGTSSLVIAWLVQSVLFGTTLALLTWAIARPLRQKALAAFEVGVWSIVLLKFVIPVGPSSPLSLAGLYEYAIAKVPSAVAVSNSEALVVADFAPTDHVAFETMQTEESGRWNWRTILAGIYFVAVSFLLATRIRSYGKLLAHCRSLPVADDPIRAMVGQVCNRMNVRRVPEARVDLSSTTTFLIGLFTPIIVISRHQFARPSELETVIVHEIAHLKRGDMIVRCLQWVVATLFFFWPVVMWVNRRIDEARECACDKWALRYGKLSTGEYARCLLNAVRPVRTSPFAHCPPAMAGHPSTIERRINMVLNSSERPTLRRDWALLMIAAISGWGMLALTGPATATEQAATATEWSATVEAVYEHTEEVDKKVLQFPVADLNDDGELSYWERITFVTVLAIEQANSIIEEDPQVDLDKDGSLSLAEVAGLVRGTVDNDKLNAEVMQAYEEYMSKGMDAATSAKTIEPKFKPLRLAIYHKALDTQEKLLAQMADVPTRKDLTKINGQLMDAFVRPATIAPPAVSSASMDELRVRLLSNRRPECVRVSSASMDELRGKIGRLRELAGQKTLELNVRIEKGDNEKDLANQRMSIRDIEAQIMLLANVLKDMEYQAAKDAAKAKPDSK